MMAKGRQINIPSEVLQEFFNRMNEPRARKNRPSVVTLFLQTANTEYTHQLPAGCKDFLIQCRTSNDVRLAFEKDHANRSQDPYFTLKADAMISADDLDLDMGRTEGEVILYFSSSDAALTVEIIQWT